MKLGSLFDGSGGFPLAGSLCGIEPVWAAEVEPYPIAVTTSRFPNMKHLGSVTDINGAEIEPVDIVCFGSPCQGLSVAGKGLGLADPRSGLFLHAIRVIKEMREATNGAYPTFIIFENVPGIFSCSGGEDFRCCLEEIIKIVEPSAVMPDVPKGGWAYADSYRGDGWSISYRVLDAQHFGKTIRDGDGGDILVRGTPQRRRRLYLVADFRGQRSREILFEFNRLPRNLEESGTPWQAAPADVEGSAGADDREGNSIAYGFPLGFRPENVRVYEETATTICNGTRPGFTTGVIAVATQATSQDQYLFQPVAYGLSSYDSNAMKSSNPHSGIYKADTSRTIDLNGGNPACNQGGIAIVEPVPYTLKIRAGCECVGVMASSAENAEITDGKISPCLMARAGTGGNQLPLIAASFYPQMKAESQCFRTDGVANTIVNGTNPGFHNGIVQPIAIDRAAFNQGQNAQYEPQFYEDGTVSTLVAKGPSAVAYGVDCRNATEYEEVNGTLQAKSNGGFSYNCNQVVRQQYIVRRLTPTECARLQGFPDRWGDIGHKTDFTDAEYAFWLNVRNTHATINGKAVKEYTKAQMLTWYNKLHTDSAEYKMWGNGVALPCPMYVMQGIKEAVNEVL